MTLHLGSSLLSVRHRGRTNVAGLWWLGINNNNNNTNNNNNNNKVFISGHAHKSKMHNRSKVRPKTRCLSTGTQTIQIKLFILSYHIVIKYLK